MTYEEATLHALVGTHQLQELLPLQTFPMVMVIDRSMTTVLEHIAPKALFSHPPTYLIPRQAHPLCSPQMMSSTNGVSKASLLVSLEVLFV